MRAAEAAKNTTDLIEGTVKRVKEGSELVEKTDKEFQELAASVGKSAELVGEISAASQEQAQGIEQINKAVSEMDKVVQQTAANSEEAAAASEELSAQAEQMKHFVKELRTLVDGSTGGAVGSSKSVNMISVERKAGGGAPAVFGVKGNPDKGNGKGPGFFKKTKTPAAQLIPFDEGDVDNF